MLDALAAIGVEIFLDLAGLACVLVDRNPNFSVRAGQRAREQARGAAFDVEEADLAEIEQLCVKASPDVHAAAMDVMGEVIEIEQARSRRLRILRVQPFELGLIGRSFGGIAIDEIQ